MESPLIMMTQMKASLPHEIEKAKIGFAPMVFETYSKNSPSTIDYGRFHKENHVN